MIFYFSPRKKLFCARSVLRQNAKLELFSWADLYLSGYRLWGYRGAGISQRCIYASLHPIPTAWMLESQVLLAHYMVVGTFPWRSSALAQPIWFAWPVSEIILMGCMIYAGHFPISKIVLQALHDTPPRCLFLLLHTFWHKKYQCIY